MEVNLITAAVPFFIATMLIEAFLQRHHRQHQYHLGTAISDVGCGIVSQIFELFLKGLALAVYAFVFAHFRLIDFSEGSVWPWIVGMVGVDFMYYWWHRSSHVVNFLWAVHGVHHQSEDFNLGVALRQPAFQPLTIYAFYLPLALIGIHPAVLVACYAINLIYQFWIHTELIDRLGPLELVLNTPSHHRVHHGINLQYLDRNYGGILIIWDRLFGTFEPEKEAVVYGVTKPLRSYNPLWANLEHWAVMAKIAANATRLRDKLWVWFAHPAWRPQAPRDQPKQVFRQNFQKYLPQTNPKLKRYILAHFALLTLASGGFMAMAETATMLSLLFPSLLFVISLIALTGMIESKRWAFWLDLARQPCILLALAVYLPGEWSIWLTTGITLGVAWCFWWMLRWIYRRN